MKIIDENRFATLIAEGEIAHSDCQFLDGIKIGLRVREEGKRLPTKIDLAQEKIIPQNINFMKLAIKPNRLYLGQTIEKLSVSTRIFGLLHTRSTISRLGIDCIGSSIYLAPGFGNGVPSSLVLEIRSSSTVKNFPLSIPLVGLLLFELDAPVRGTKRGTLGFPF
jgi:deoxycytidine triphosphate deaminase